MFLNLITATHSPIDKYTSSKLFSLPVGWVLGRRDAADQEEGRNGEHCEDGDQPKEGEVVVGGNEDDLEQEVKQ